MKTLIVVLSIWCVGWNFVFIVDFLIGSRRRMNGITGRDVVLSSLGSLGVLGAVVVDLVADAPWSRWLPGLAVMSFAAIGYPAWWLRMRTLTRRAEHRPDRL